LDLRVTALVSLNDRSELVESLHQDQALLVVSDGLDAVNLFRSLYQLLEHLNAEHRHAHLLVEDGLVVLGGQVCQAEIYLRLAKLDQHIFFVKVPQVSDPHQLHLDFLQSVEASDRLVLTYHDFIFLGLLLADDLAVVSDEVMQHLHRVLKEVLALANTPVDLLEGLSEELVGWAFVLEEEVHDCLPGQDG
jgi:hypothetical protein